MSSDNIYLFIFHFIDFRKLIVNRINWVTKKKFLLSCKDN